GVREHRLAEGDRRRRGKNFLLETLTGAEGKAPRMIHVRMREHDCVDLRDVRGERFVLLLDIGAMSLKQPAVEQHRAAVDMEDVARTRELGSRAVELDVRHAIGVVPDRRTPGAACTLASSFATPREYDRQ